MDAALHRTWIHAFEEDDGSTETYRPRGHRLPPARGRKAMELRSDGTFVDWPIGPADRAIGAHGRWSEAGPDRIRVEFPDEDRPPRVLEIVELGSDILTIRVVEA